MSRARVAVNPIPYWARDGRVDKSRAVFEEAFADYERIGIRRVKADVPEGMSAGEYREWIGGYGLEPAISTVMVPFDVEAPLDATGGLDAAARDRLRRFAADQVALGLTAAMFIAPMTPERIAAPTRAVGDSPELRERVAAGLGAASDVVRAEGLYPGIHQHVGSLVESEAELRSVLGELGPERLGFAPDSGHLAWAGADPAALVAEYAATYGEAHPQGIVGVHVKDVFPDFLGDAPAAAPTGDAIETASAPTSLGYHEIGATQRLWAEPGLGVVDLAGFLDALPPTFAGDVMIEVDVPSVESRYESARMAHEWALAHLGGAA